MLDDNIWLQLLQHFRTHWSRGLYDFCRRFLSTC